MKSTEPGSTQLAARMDKLAKRIVLWAGAVAAVVALWIQVAPHLSLLGPLTLLALGLLGWRLAWCRHSVFESVTTQHVCLYITLACLFGAVIFCLSLVVDHLAFMTQALNQGEIDSPAPSMFPFMLWFGSALAWGTLTLFSINAAYTSSLSGTLNEWREELESSDRAALGGGGDSSA